MFSFDFVALKEMWARGWPVMSILLGCSVLSFAMILERWFTLSRAEFNRNKLIKKLYGFFSENRREAAAVHIENFGKPVGRVLTSVLQSGTSDREKLERLASRQIQAEIMEMSRFVTGLGTIGSIAPYVGLFGTVLGIIHAFKAIASNAGGGPGAVAHGISEALVTTALGLFVAIPAVIGYNMLSRKAERIAEEMELTSGQVIDWISK